MPSLGTFCLFLSLIVLSVRADCGQPHAFQLDGSFFDRFPSGYIKTLVCDEPEPVVYNLLCADKLWQIESQPPGIPFKLCNKARDEMIQIENIDISVINEEGKFTAIRNFSVEQPEVVTDYIPPENLDQLKCIDSGHNGHQLWTIQFSQSVAFSRVTIYLKGQVSLDQPSLIYLNPKSKMTCSQLGNVTISPSLTDILIGNFYDKIFPATDEINYNSSDHSEAEKNSKTYPEKPEFTRVSYLCSIKGDFTHDLSRSNMTYQYEQVVPSNLTIAIGSMTQVQLCGLYIAEGLPFQCGYEPNLINGTAFSDSLPLTLHRDSTTEQIATSRLKFDCNAGYQRSGDWSGHDAQSGTICDGTGQWTGLPGQCTETGPTGDETSSTLGQDQPKLVPDRRTSGQVDVVGTSQPTPSVLVSNSTPVSSREQETSTHRSVVEEEKMAATNVRMTRGEEATSWTPTPECPETTTDTEGTYKVLLYGLAIISVLVICLSILTTYTVVKCRIKKKYYNNWKKNSGSMSWLMNSYEPVNSRTEASKFDDTTYRPMSRSIENFLDHPNHSFGRTTKDKTTEL
ncbi:hypothetical protein HDE_05360 [Halotydeus destructor]|nr:hypothetical protein HDE_05360 [Halotydeus destructor]